MQITLRMLQNIIGMMIIVGVVIVVNQASRKINAKNFFNLPFLDQYSQKLRVIFSLHNVSNRKLSREIPKNDTACPIFLFQWFPECVLPIF